MNTRNLGMVASVALLSLGLTAGAQTQQSSMTFFISSVGAGAAMVGHHDRWGLRDDAPSVSWNASHPSRGCSLDNLRASGGAGMIYCFAAK